MIIKTFERFLEEYSNLGPENENYNIPPGVQDPAGADEDQIEDPEINIRPETHELKLMKVNGVPVTDFSELALLQNKAGEIFLLQFDATQEDFDAYKPRLVFGDDSEYLDLTEMGVEAIANDIPLAEKGEGVKDLDKKMLIKIDAEAADALDLEMNEIIGKLDREMAKPYAAMKQVLMNFTGA
jgi:hypothetical protein